MGVKGLWQLLLPTGRRISIETLQGKRLAIDASIWLVQFLKANRDPETGKVRANAHLLGFLRRICKLLFHGIRPVFVFDGATPEIKLAEIRRRRERRERLHSFKSDDDEGVKRLARRLLISNLKKQKETEKRLASSLNSGFAPGFFSPKNENSVDVRNTEYKNEKIDQKAINDIQDEILVLSDSEEYLKQAAEKDQPMQINDWDHLSEDATSLKSDDSFDIEVDEDAFDVKTLSQLPSKMRVGIIEKARVQQRLNSRKEFMSVASNPENYSQCQLRNFLKSSRLNQKVNELATVVKGEDGLEGERMASDSTKRIVFTKEVQSSDQLEESQPQTDEEKQNYYSPVRGRKRLRTPTSKKDDDDDSDVTESAIIPTKGTILFSLLDDDDDNEASVCANLKQTTFSSFNSKNDNQVELQITKYGAKRGISNRRQVIELSDDDDEFTTTNPSLANEYLEDGEGGFLRTDEYTESVHAPNKSSGDGEGGFLRTDESTETVHPPNKSLEDGEGGLLRTDESTASVHAPRLQIEKQNSIENASDDEDVNMIFMKSSAPSLKNTVLLDTKLEEYHSNDNDTIADDIDWEDCELNEPQTFTKSDILSNTNERTLESASFKLLNQIDSNTFVECVNDKYLHITQKSFPGGILSFENDDSSVLESSKDIHRELYFSDHFSHDDKDESYIRDTQKMNTEAIMRAQATASKLTDWAGRAVQRAFAAHIGASNGEPGNNKDDNEELSQSVSSGSLDDVAPTAKTSLKNIDTSLEGLSKEDFILREESNRMQRDMDTVTDEMVYEVMELLTIFGIPYMKAPAEAEAQCVELEKLGLVDGIVTEDSDAIVFGCKTLYKNMFEDQKYVEVYLSSDSEKIGIGFKEKIALAMLLGGDYTQGVKGVGIVNGMEILEAFGPWSEDVDVGDRLKAFRKWLDGYDISNNSDEEDSSNPIIRFQMKHRSARSRWIVPSDFPATNVLQAYSRPVVDSSDCAFSWEKPNIEQLRSFLLRKIGWDSSETDKVILPIISQSRQTRIDGYFMRMEDEIKFAEVKSNRLKKVWHNSKNSDK